MLYQQKVDGVFSVRDLGGDVLAGELCGGAFYAFDLLRHGGEDCRHWPCRERWRALCAIDLAAAGMCLVPSSSDGAGLLQAVLAAGGEGVVAKGWHDNYFAGMLACKRLETFYCIVTGINAGQSVRLAFLPPVFDNLESGGAFLSVENLEPAGNMPLRGGKADCVRIGSILKVEAYGRHASGLLREARPCSDTATSWLIKF